MRGNPAPQPNVARRVEQQVGEQTDGLHGRVVKDALGEQRMLGTPHQETDLGCHQRVGDVAVRERGMHDARIGRSQLGKPPQDAVLPRLLDARRPGTHHRRPQDERARGQVEAGVDVQLDGAGLQTAGEGLQIDAIQRAAEHHRRHAHQGRGAEHPNQGDIAAELEAQPDQRRPERVAAPLRADVDEGLGDLFSAGGTGV